MTRSTAPEDIVGLIPAAGRASRMGPLPCSKEILPIGVWRDPLSSGRRIAVLGDCLLDQYRASGIRRVVTILAPGKTDVARYYGDGAGDDLDIDYLFVDSPSTPFSLDTAYPRVRDRICALGFPDILYPADPVFGKLIAVLDATPADVVLGLFPTRHANRVDMVRCDGAGRVDSILIKPESLPEDHRLSWLVALWRPGFSDFLHEEVKRPVGTDEIYVGDIVNRALRTGFRVHGVQVSEAPCLDAGTPETYAQAIAEFAGRQAR